MKYLFVLFSSVLCLGLSGREEGRGEGGVGGMDE